jgi:hypothetical protein
MATRLGMNLGAGRVVIGARATTALARAMIVVGAPVGGLLGDPIGFRLVLGVAALGFLLSALGLGMTSFRQARLPTTPI